MAVTEADVIKIASLAHLRLKDTAEVHALAEQMNSILGHMEVLSGVDTTKVEPMIGIGVPGMPLRDDAVAPIPMEFSAESLTHDSRDGFILVPRLSTHGDAG